MFRNDWVKIYEGDDNTPVENGVLCGANYPDKIISNSNRMVIESHSDDQETNTGYRIKVETGTTSMQQIINYIRND